MPSTPNVLAVTSVGSVPTNQAAVPVILLNDVGGRAGVVTRAAAQADTTAADLAALKVDFNALLAKLRTAGVIAP